VRNASLSFVADARTHERAHVGRRGRAPSSTRGEEWLWRQLAGSRTGFAFRRQLVIGNHIVDVACTKVRLVVEVDGSSHDGRGRHDAARDRALGALGWAVLRVTEADVIADLDGVVRRVVAVASARPRVGR
jgi:very-short-patch-repair endonuclease